MKKLVSFVLCFGLIGTIFSSASALKSDPLKDIGTEKTDKKPEIWVSSSEFAPKVPYTANDYAKYYDLLKSVFNKHSPWKTVRKDIDVFKFYEVGVNHIEKNPEVYRSVFEFLNKSKISIAIDVGGFYPGTFETGEKAARYEIQQMFKKIIELGGDLKYISLDNYFNRMLNMLDRWKYTEEKAISELIEYIRTIREELPELKIGLIECAWNNNFVTADGINYPEINPATKRFDSPALYEKFFNELEKQSLKIDFFTTECAYTQAELKDYGWIRNKAIEDYFKSKGVKVGFIYNDNKGGNTSNELFYTNTLKAYDEYHSVGGDPDYMIVQSWYKYPNIILPEDEPYTFMNLVRDFISKVREKGEKKEKDKQE